MEKSTKLDRERSKREDLCTLPQRDVIEVPCKECASPMNVIVMFKHIKEITCIKCGALNSVET